MGLQVETRLARAGEEQILHHRHENSWGYFGNRPSDLNSSGRMRAVKISRSHTGHVHGKKESGLVVSALMLPEANMEK